MASTPATERGPAEAARNLPAEWVCGIGGRECPTATAPAEGARRGAVGVVCPTVARRSRGDLMLEPGSVHFDTADIAVHEREEAVRDVVCKAVVRVKMEHLRRESEGIELWLNSADLGPLTVQSLRFSATACERTARLAHDDSPSSVFLAVKRTGSSTVVQEGRKAVVGAGHVALWSSTRSSMILSPDRSQHHLLRIPTQLLGVPETALRQAVAVPLGPELPIVGVLGRFVDDLVSLPNVKPAEAEHLARPATELTRALIAVISDDSRRARESLDATLQLRVGDYLLAHWHELDLTAERIATAHQISTRHLYRLLAAQGISLNKWLRDRRLEACRDALTKPGAVAATVSSVGRRWGFLDATNFGRTFKAAYGLTPLEWRLLHQKAQRPSSP